MIKANDLDGYDISEISIALMRFSLIEDHDVLEFVEAAKQRHPKATDLSKPKSHDNVSHLQTPFYEYQSPSPKQILKYNNEYDKWVNNLRTFFAGLPSRLGSDGSYSNIIIIIENKGNVPAENVSVKLTAVGGIMLAPPGKERRHSPPHSLPALPRPPQAPQGKYVSKLASASIDLPNHLSRIPSAAMIAEPAYNLVPAAGLEALTMNRERLCDRHAFYWNLPRENKTVWEFTCKEFRHQVEPWDREITIFVPSDHKVSNAALKCRVTAKNLRKPQEFNVPFEITETEVDSKAKAREIISRS